VEAQQEKMGFKTFFRQGEMTTLLRSCATGLDQAVEAFMVKSGSVSVCGLNKKIPAG
jgi:hypothetical protein